MAKTSKDEKTPKSPGFKLKETALELLSQNKEWKKNIQTQQKNIEALYNELISHTKRTGGQDLLEQIMSLY